MPTRHVLLTRDEFRRQVLARCGGACCVPGCGEAATAAHHILERRLFEDGGYYLANGAPLCDGHHLMAETTEIAADRLREWCGVAAPVLPPRTEAARKALARGGFLDLFTPLVKYPRTWHVPFSPGATDDDKVLGALDHFAGRRVVVTVKKDGENSTLMRDHFHARSLDSRHHPSRDWIKGFWAAVRFDIPEEWRVCGENLYARHTIAYDALPSYFLGFSVWDERNVCLSWDETMEWFELIGNGCGTRIEPVEALYDGPFDEAALRDLAQGALAAGEEGVVVRLADAFAYRDFRRSVAKFVRPGHVATSKHWMHEKIVPNGLAAPAGFRP